jgi:hypothetical protein
MTNEIINCPQCHHEFTVRRHNKARWAAAGAGALVGGTATESVLGGILFGAIAYSVARAYDEHRAHRCPECKTVTFPAKRGGERVAVPEEAEVVRH